MPLDERTLLFIVALLPGLLGLVVGGIHTVLPKEVRGPGSWALSLAGASLAALLLGWEDGPARNSVLLLSNGSLVASITLQGIALREIRGLPSRVGLRWAVAGALYGLAAHLTLGWPHQPLRIALIMAFLAATHLQAAWGLVHEPEMRRRFGGRVLLAGLLLYGATAAFRLGASLSGSSGPVAVLSGQAGPNIPYFLGVLSGLTLASLGMVLVATERLMRRVEHLATHDALTGVLNRNGFRPLAEHALAHARRVGGEVALAVVDLDHFKAINDQHGHQAGDLALHAVAKALQGALRQMDLLCRFGGEEFAVLLPGASEPVAAQACERLRLAVEALALEVQGRRIPLTASLGVAAQTGDLADLDALFSRADAAVYAAKHQGRNRVVLASEGSRPTGGA